MNNNDLQQIDQLLTKRLSEQKKELIEHIDSVANDIIEAVDKNKADKTELQDLEKRVEKLEQPIF